MNWDFLAMQWTRNWLSIHWDVLFVMSRLFSVRKNISQFSWDKNNIAVHNFFWKLKHTDVCSIHWKEMFVKRRSIHWIVFRPSFSAQRNCTLKGQGSCASCNKWQIPPECSSFPIGMWSLIKVDWYSLDRFRFAESWKDTTSMTFSGLGVPARVEIPL